MINYILRRLILLPLTLFCIILINFVIINLAPGDPVTITEVSAEGEATRQEDHAMAFGSDSRYLQFREHYGLTLPIIINLWPFTSLKSVKEKLALLVTRDGLNVKEYNQLRIRFGDRSRFVMPHLLTVIEDDAEPLSIREMAVRFFIRGGTRQAYLGANITREERAYNRKISKDNQILSGFTLQDRDQIRDWYEENKAFYTFEPTMAEKLGIVFETRFNRYMGRVLTLNFGTMRNDANKTVITEVTKRFKYSLTLALVPMLITFFLCQLFGFLMAFKQNQPIDFTLNVIFLILYAIPIFVVAPFLIEKVALNNTFPFTDIPIPISGFTSSESVYSQLTSNERVWNVIQHIFLPLVAIMYGSLAASTRLSRTAVLETMRQDYVRTAHSKGLSTFMVMFKHVGRNAAITIVTALAGSLGVVLGGSLIVETLFDINGFGKFFYEAVLNRDYNVIMFSAIAGSFLTLMGYLAADIAYTTLDPRVTLD